MDFLTLSGRELKSIYCVYCRSRNGNVDIDGGSEMCPQLWVGILMCCVKLKRLSNIRKFCTFIIRGVAVYIEIAKEQKRWSDWKKCCDKFWEG